jgi:hypothetical protein
MKSLDFPGATLKIGANQTDIYNVIHAYPLDGEEKEIIAIYELSEEERAEVAKTGRIYYSRLTFGAPFQPMRFSATPIEINIRFKGEEIPENHIAGVTEHGIVIPGYHKVQSEDGELWKKD